MIQKEEMSDQRDERWLGRLITLSETGGRIEPKWEPSHRSGYVYSREMDELDDAELRRDLEDLSRFGYLERNFVDRLALCPTCRSHTLNVREVCLSCKSSNLAPVETFHHYRCGYVGPSYAFALDDRGRRCPKCARILRDLGTDYESPGTSFSCRVCDASFQLPDIGSLCLSCGQRLVGQEMQKITYADVYSYRLSSLGRGAVTAGRLLDREDETRYDRGSQIFRRSVIMAMIEDERRRKRRFGTPFSLIILKLADAQAEHVVISALFELLAETDKVGRLDSDHVLVVMPSIATKGARAILKQLERHPDPMVHAGVGRVAVVELADAANTEQRIIEASRWMSR
jgi:hypothetical protein